MRHETPDADLVTSSFGHTTNVPMRTTAVPCLRSGKVGDRWTRQSKEGEGEGEATKTVVRRPDGFDIRPRRLERPLGLIWGTFVATLAGRPCCQSASRRRPSSYLAAP